MKIDFLRLSNLCHVRLASLFLMLATTTCAKSAAQPPVTALAFNPSGDLIISGSQDEISIRSWPSLEKVDNYAIEVEKIQAIQFSPNGTQLIVVGGKPSEIGQWRIIAWPSLSTIVSGTGHHDVIHDVAWLAEDRFVTGGADSKVIQWERRDNQPTGDRVRIVRRLTGHSRRVLSVESIDNGQCLVSAGVDRSLRMWGDASMAEKPLRVLDNHTGIVRDLAKRPGERSTDYLVSASADKTVRIWVPKIGRLVRFARLPVEPLCVTWTSDGNRIGAGCTDGKLRVINANTVKVEQTLPAIEGWAYSVIASHDGSFAVGGSNGALVRIESD